MVRDIAIEGGTVDAHDRPHSSWLPSAGELRGAGDSARWRRSRASSRSALGFDVMSPEEKTALTTRLRGGVAERTPGISVGRVDARYRRRERQGRGRQVLPDRQPGGRLRGDGAANRRPRRRRLRLFDPDDARNQPAPRRGRQDDRPAGQGDLKVMSIGFFLDENTPIMWRGPMLHRALEQFLSDVHWGELDTLVVDMPPGTGDVAISLGQLLPRAEAVVVTTPHRAAQQVAVRAAQMARKTNMRLLGVVENMSYLARGSAAKSSSARAAARRLPARSRHHFSGAFRSTRASGAYADEGEPIVDAEPDPRSRRRSSPWRRRSRPPSASRASASSSRSRSSPPERVSTGSRAGLRGGRCRARSPTTSRTRTGAVGPGTALTARLARRAARSRSLLEPGAGGRGARLRALGGERRARLPCRSPHRRGADLRSTVPGAPGGRLAHLPDRLPRLLGAAARRQRARRSADDHLAGPPRQSRGRPTPGRDESARDCDPELRRQARSSPTSRWGR